MILEDEELKQKQYQRALNSSGYVDQVLGFTYPDKALYFSGQSDCPQIDVRIFYQASIANIYGK